jgi:hypothetical protein
MICLELLLMVFFFCFVQEDRKRKSKVPIHKQFSHHSKARKSKNRKLKEALEEEVKEEKKRRRDALHNEADYPAIDSLYDPQGFGEKLLTKLKKGLKRGGETSFL